MSWVGWVRLKLLAVQVQAVTKPTLKDCLPKSCMMKVALISLGWIPPAQVLLNTTLRPQQSDSFEQDHLQETVLQTKEWQTPVLSYCAVLFNLWLQYCTCFIFPMLKYHFNENNVLHKQIFKTVSYIPSVIPLTQGMLTNLPNRSYWKKRFTGGNWQQAVLEEEHHKSDERWYRVLTHRNFCSMK